LGFAGFSIFWTVLAPYLSIAPFNLNTVEIGFIGIAGLAGVAAARVAGWAVDKGYARISTPGSWAIIAGSFIALYLARHSLLAIVIVAATLDLGIQGIHITNQSIIYRISPDAQARITTAYMGTYFIGGAIGSALATVTYANFQYAGTALLGVGVSFLGILLWFFGRKKEAALIQKMGDRQPDHD
jgi:predicted MFS family arabinose efflux permease